MILIGRRRRGGVSERENFEEDVNEMNERDIQRS